MSHEKAPYTTPAEAPAPALLSAEPNSISLLVARFAHALNEKMQAAAIKYGYQSDQWLDPNWRTDCIEDLLRHVDKGDPRDVAAYCAFAWHHGWSLTPATTLLRMSERAIAAEAQVAGLKEELGEQEKEKFQLIRELSLAVGSSPVAAR